MSGVRVLHGYTRSTVGSDLDGRFGADHLAAAMPEPDAVFVCGPPGLVEAVREHCPNMRSESFVPPVFDHSGAKHPAAESVFTDSGVDLTDDGRPLLNRPRPQA